jgi:hypothetical protein
MTTFTMQDLNTMEVTQEEDQAMQALTEKQKEQEVIQSVMGLQYTPMDTSPQAQELSNLFVNLTATMQAIIKLCVETQSKAQPQPSKELNETVDTVLSEAEWFREMVGEKASDHIDNMDFEYEVGNHVERYFRNEFSLEDHVNIHDEIEREVSEVVERIVEEKLSNATFSVDFN